MITTGLRNKDTPTESSINILTPARLRSSLRLAFVKRYQESNVDLTPKPQNPKRYRISTSVTEKKSTCNRAPSNFGSHGNVSP